MFIIFNNIYIQVLLHLGLALSWFQRLLNNVNVLPRRYLRASGVSYFVCKYLYVWYTRLKMEASTSSAVIAEAV
jgi:hypothetical protein